MSENTSTAADKQQNSTEEKEFDFSVEGLSDDRVSNIIENTRIESGEGEMPLETAMLDLAVAHKELEEYKKGALAMYQELDERQHEAEAAGNEELAHILGEVKKTAYGVYLRLHRGDAELLGERDGKFTGYFDSDEPTPTPDDAEVADGSA